MKACWHVRAQDGMCGATLSLITPCMCGERQEAQAAAAQESLSLGVRTEAAEQADRLIALQAQLLQERAAFEVEVEELEAKRLLPSARPCSHLVPRARASCVHPSCVHVYLSVCILHDMRVCIWERERARVREETAAESRGQRGESR